MPNTSSLNNSVVPYIRYNEVEFAAHSLKPYKISKLFFDDVVINQFCQAANRMLLDSKKIITVNSNNATVITSGDRVYQGTSANVNTFNAIVETYYSGNTTVVVRRLNGAFDKDSQLFVENNSTNVIFANCNVVSVVNKDTSDLFYPGEGVIAPERNNCYATVVSTSGENVLYLNKNYISLNVTAVGANLITAMSNQFKPGDIVYQTVSGSPRYDQASFTGVVKYFNHLGDTGVGAIAIDPLSGYMNANSTASGSNGLAFLWNTSTPASQPLGVKAVNTADFTSNSNVQSVVNTSVKINVSSWVHRSGVISDVNAPNTQSMILNSGSGLNPANANLIYFVTGPGVGQFKRVVAVSGSLITLNSAISFSPNVQTHYTIGNFETDEYGSLAGIYHIPSYSTFKFKTGERIFTITDSSKVTDPDYTMRAAAKYVASGALPSQKTLTSPYLPPLPEMNSDALVRPLSPSDRTFNTTANKNPVTGSTASSTPRIPLGDGLSQTFFTPKPEGNATDYGIFCTSIDLFFKNKPAPGGFFNNSRLQKRSAMQLPVTVKIAEVQNGYPTKNYVASKTLQAKDVNVSDLPSTSNSSTVTKFTFDDPVYLEPAREYAITVQSDSPDYELYIAEIGSDVLGAVPTRRISEQPYSGTLFRAQNSSTWAPYLNEDLMFVLNKAVFNTSGTATFNLKDTPLANTDVDRVMLITSSLTFPAANATYSLKGINSSTNAYDSANGVNLIPNKMLEYGSLGDASGKTRFTRNSRRLKTGNANSFILSTELTTTSTDVSPIVNLERLAVQATTYFINNGGLSNTLISITNPGAGYNALSSTLSSNIIKGSSNTSMNNYAQLYRETYLANNANIGFYAVTISGGGPNAAGAMGFAVANTDGANTINYVVLPSEGYRYVETPTITFETGNATSTTTATGQVNGETDKAGGNMMARYICREIVLEDGFESGDLRVFMDAVRTSVADIQVYYKVLSPDDPQNISQKRWLRMEKVNDVYSKDLSTVIGLEFRPSLTENRISYTENGVNYPIGGTFKSFQIKVCLLSSDTATVPKVKNLRITAVPEG